MGTSRCVECRNAPQKAAEATLVELETAAMSNGYAAHRLSSEPSEYLRIDVDDGFRYFSVIVTRFQDLEVELTRSEAVEVLR